MMPMILSHERHRLLVQCLAERAQPLARSRRFILYPLGPGSDAGGIDDIILVHDFAPGEIDNNIASYVADELLPLLLTCSTRGEPADGYRASDQEVFERFVGEIVRSIDGNEERAWHLFYDNTLAALNRAGQRDGDAESETRAPNDFIAEFATIYRRVADLAAECRPASVLDVATCFGFLPLLLVSALSPQPKGCWQNPRVVGCDLNPALIALANSYARQRRLAGVCFVEADIRDAFHPALPQRSFDVVTAIHLLEHLEPTETALAMDRLWHLARRRLIVAVPVEAVPDPRFGHRQVFDRESLSALGRTTGGLCRSFEDHGAWLVIDREQIDQEQGATHTHHRLEGAWT